MLSLRTQAQRSIYYIMLRKCKVICVDRNVSVCACGWRKEEGMPTGKEDALGVLGVLADCDGFTGAHVPKGTRPYAFDMCSYLSTTVSSYIMS